MKAAAAKRAIGKTGSNPDGGAIDDCCDPRVALLSPVFFVFKLAAVGSNFIIFGELERLWRLLFDINAGVDSTDSAVASRIGGNFIANNLSSGTIERNCSFSATTSPKRLFRFRILNMVI